MSYEIQLKSGKLRGSILSDDLANCPLAIYSGDHWLPRHKIEDCGGSEVAVTIKGKKPEEKPKLERVAVPKIHKPKSIIQVEKPMSVHYEDKELACVGKNCKSGGSFIYSGDEQKFMRSLVGKDGGFAEYSEPKRCKPCRDEKRKFFNKENA